MKNRLFSLSLIFTLNILIPGNALAYFTTAQSAEFTEDGGGILYSVTYDFGMKGCNLYLPIVPQRSEGSDFSYVIHDNKNNLTYTEGTSVGVVVSDALVTNKSYFIPKGEARRLTLIVLLTLPSQYSKDMDLSLWVTGLPFEINCSAKKSVNAQLNPSELQYYRTPTVSVSER